MNHVVCVKWGTLYGPEFVNNLYAACKRNLTIPFQFHCITNNSQGIHNDINILANEDKHLKGWWQKIIYFKNPLYNIEGPVLTLDLDLIIVNNINCFFNHRSGDFCMKQDHARHGHSSCVMRFNANQYPHIYNRFDVEKLKNDISIDNSDKKNFKKGKKFWGDQLWITDQMRKDPKKRKVQLWPQQWIKLFGRTTHRKVTRDHRTKKIKCENFFVPPGTKIIAWAGWKNDQNRVYDKIKQYYHSDNLTDDYRK